MFSTKYQEFRVSALTDLTNNFFKHTSAPLVGVGAGKNPAADSLFIQALESTESKS